MRKYLIYIVFTFILFTVPGKVTVKAASSCDNRTLVDYREQIKNIKIYTDYRLVDGRALFDVTITNIPFNVYVEDVTNEKTYKYESFTTQNELIIKDYLGNRKLTYRFYMETPGCYGEVLGSRVVSLPNYNRRVNDPLCEGIEEFNLCQKWGTVNVSYSDFERRTSEYREQKGLENPNEQEEIPQESMKNKIINFIGEYYIYLVAAVAIIVLMIVAIKTKAEERSEFDFKV